MALIRCSECNSNVSEKASECPKCGCPVTVSKEIIVSQKKRRVQNVFKGAVGLAILAFIVIVIMIFINSPNTDGYYQDTRWGMTVEQVKKVVGESAIVGKEGDSVLITFEDYEGKTGIDAMIYYSCEEGGLHEVTLYLTNGDDSSYTDSRLTDEYIENFNKSFGEFQEKTLVKYWNTPKSRIELLHFMSGIIIITYEDITNVKD